jgi:integrase
MATVTLYLRVKQDDKYPYYPASIAANKRLEPLVALVDGRRKTFSDGTYYIRYSDGSKQQPFLAVGKDPATAWQAKLDKEYELNSQIGNPTIAAAATVPVAKEDRLLAAVVQKYLDEIRANKSYKTWRAYSRSLELFQQSCTKSLLRDVEREDLLAFKLYLRKQFTSEKGKRTVYNHFLNVMTFFSKVKHQTGIESGDWCAKPERDPQTYTDKELTAMFDESTDFERLVLKGLLFSAFRSGELAHLTYGDIDFTDNFFRVTEKPCSCSHCKKNGGVWTPKTEESNNREVPIHSEYIKKLVERMRALSAKKTDLVFPAPEGGVDHHLLRIVTRVARRCKFDDIRVDDHKFRSTAISRWLEAGYTVPQVAAFVGHNNLETIKRYAEKVNARKPEHRAKADKLAERYVNAGD